MCTFKLASALMFAALALVVNAEAKSIESAVGAKKMSQITNKGSSSTAVLYVHNGLVTMFDAIENAGYGKHNEASRKIQNLVPGNAAWELPAFASFAEDEACVYFKRDSVPRTYYIPSSCFTTAVGATNWHAEVVMCPLMTNVYSDSGFIVFKGGYGWWMRPIPALRTRNMANEAIIVTQPEKVSLGVRGNPADLTYVQFFKNATLFVQQKTTSQNAVDPFGIIELYANGAKGFDMKLYCIRIYNRPLTDEEMAHNYEIDKMRFGL